MANTQIDITTNGTTTLATAGKYCDRNIDVNVEVPAEATQFTNYYDPENVTLKYNIAGSSSEEGAVLTSDNYTNYIMIPYHHVANEPFVLRMRGIGTVRDRFGCLIFKEDGETKENHYQLSNTSYFTQSYDEYGDAMITFTSNITYREWYYFAFNFQYIGINSGATTAKTGPIITINEPIGNGGYAE